jgi:hypothetical protein
VNNCQLNLELPEGSADMSFVVLLLGLGVLMGAAAHISLTAFTLAAAVIGLWLVGFAVREGIARHRS